MLKIPKKYSSFEFIRSAKWSEVFDFWREREAHQKSWKKFWEERGFESWDEWRKAYCAPLSPEKLDWFLYKVKNPLKDFPIIYGVPSLGWIKEVYNGEKTMQFKNIANLSIISKYPKMNAIKNDFPKETTLIGMIFENKIILIEGMHRACALASWDKSKLFESKITFALASWNQKEIPIIGGNYKNKS